MKRKLLSMLLVMVLCLTACGGNTEETSQPASESTEAEESAETAEVKDTLTVAIVSDPATMYPYYMLSGTGRALYTPVYEALFMYDEGTKPEPILVDSYTVDEDGMGITMNLKQGILFHDGSEMVASDVLFSLDCLLNSNYASNIGDIDRENCTVVDDYTVYFHYNSVQGPLLYQLCNLYVLSEAYMSSINEDEWTYNCIGTGPYMWGDYSAGTEYHLEKFEDYREEKALSEIIVRIIPESSVQVVELETGGIDLAMGIGYGDVMKYEEDAADGYSVTKGPAIGSFVLQTALTNEVMLNENVRLAMAYACDYAGVNQIAYSGLATPSTNVFPNGIAAWEEAENQHTFDPEYAKQLLAEGGYPDGVTVDVYITNDTAGTQTAEVLIASCAQAGITLNVTSCDYATMGNYLSSGTPGFYLNTVYANGDPNIILSYYNGPFYGDVLNMAATERYEEMCEYLTEAAVTIDEDARIEIYREAMQVMYDTCYAIPLMDLSDIAVHPDNLEGYWMGGPAYHYEDCAWK